MELCKKFDLRFIVIHDWYNDKDKTENSSSSQDYSARLKQLNSKIVELSAKKISLQGDVCFFLRLCS